MIRVESSASKRSAISGTLLFVTGIACIEIRNSKSYIGIRIGVGKFEILVLSIDLSIVRFSISTLFVNLVFDNCAGMFYLISTHTSKHSEEAYATRFA